MPETAELTDGAELAQSTRETASELTGHAEITEQSFQAVLMGNAERRQPKETYASVLTDNADLTQVQSDLSELVESETSSAGTELSSTGPSGF